MTVVPGVTAAPPRHDRRPPPILALPHPRLPLPLRPTPLAPPPGTRDFQSMCFSTTASFAAGTSLSAIGVVTLRHAKRTAEVPFALIPLLFGIQHPTEGGVWLTFSHDAPAPGAARRHIGRFPGSPVVSTAPGSRKQYATRCANAWGRSRAFASSGVVNGTSPIPEGSKAQRSAEVRGILPFRRSVCGLFRDK